MEMNITLYIDVIMCLQITPFSIIRMRDKKESDLITCRYR